MERLTLTPFGRQSHSHARSKLPAPRTSPVTGSIDKWKLFERLRIGHEAFGVSYRNLAVLNALLTFLPQRELDGTKPLVVFPSNRTLSDRAHGMPESTLRRHLAALLKAGLINRQDSPNGKRYAARGRGGEMLHAFGFDLRPLVERSEEIAEAATRVEEDRDICRRLKERLSLLKRDLLAFADGYADHTEANTISDGLAELQRVVRRKPNRSILEALAERMTNLRDNLAGEQTTESRLSNVKDAEFERHLQKPEEDPSDYAGSQLSTQSHGMTVTNALTAFPKAIELTDRPLSNWQDFVEFAGNIRKLMSVDQSTWTSSTGMVGRDVAAICLLYILERLDEIRNPGGYLRTLVRKISAGRLQPSTLLQRPVFD
ncbi:replication initiation protein RepC [Palleronia aestuarii]|uniref:Replication initiation protein RepC n=1 Tax=Palleronia aestuarii TaxID=568105 RepID=A0A2W7N589_9RHOB|nr:plasmid replication protein RepC [Palleronia aestuarii]PZX14893.1 replication initiation protein RepC [Palleronia aestuarii]